MPTCAHLLTRCDEESQHVVGANIRRRLLSEGKGVAFQIVAVSSETTENNIVRVSKTHTDYQLVTKKTSGQSNMT